MKIDSRLPVKKLACIVYDVLINDFVINDFIEFYDFPAFEGYYDYSAFT